MKLIIFVDAFPYERIKSITTKIQGNYSAAKMRPILGYSVNLKSALFAGLSPEEVGFFNEWAPSKLKADFKKYVCIKIFGCIGNLNQLLNGILHKIYNRLFKTNIYRIPFNLLFFFDKMAIDAYQRNYPNKTIFSEYCYDRIIYSDFTGRDIDLKVFEAAQQKIKSESANKLFVAFSGLDEGMHTHGTRGLEFELLIEKYSFYIAELWNLCKLSSDKSDIIFVSDHGMSNPKASISLNIEKYIGVASNKTYLYFIDATMLRFWIYDDKYYHIVNRFLKENNLNKLTESQRIHHKISNRIFGDVIVVLNDDQIFAPSFFGRRPAKGMHGYSPIFDSQLGCFISSRKEDLIELNPYEVYEKLKTHSSDI